MEGKRKLFAQAGADTAGAGPPQPPAGQNEEPEAPRMSVLSKLSLIWIWPSVVFTNLGTYPEFIFPLVLAWLINFASDYLSRDYNASVERQHAVLTWQANPVGVAMDEPLMLNGHGHSLWAMVLVNPIVIFAFWIIAAALLYGLYRLIEGDVDVRKLFSIVAFSSLPASLHPLVNAIYTITQKPVIRSFDDYRAAITPWSLSIGHFFPVHSAPYRFFAHFDLFTFWSICLVYTGLVYGLGAKPVRAGRIVYFYALLGIAYMLISMLATGLHKP